MNMMKTALLLAGLTALFMALGYMLGGQTGMMLALAFAIITNLFTYWNGDKMVLSMQGASEIGPGDVPGFYAVVKQLAARANLPMPKVYIIDNPLPNAFATGRNPQNSAVAATTGLLNNLSEREIAAVMAHELGHIRNRDTLLMTITATLAGAISMLANFGMFFGDRRDNQSALSHLAMIILAPLAAMLVQMAISRTREYGADRDGALIAGDPEGLASALERIEQLAHGNPHIAAETNPAFAHLFIINPLLGGRMDNLFSTHPATENRVMALRQMSGEQRHASSSRTQENSGSSGPWSTRSGPWG